MSETIYRRSWRKPARRAGLVLGTPSYAALAGAVAQAFSALQGARATIVQLWEDAPAEYAAGNIGVVGAAQWSAAFAAEAAVIDGALATMVGTA